jgi:hypothetical protein
MNFISIETPAPRVALAGEPLELFDALLGIVASSQPLEIFPDQLIEALAESLGFPAGPGDGLLVKRKGHIHLFDPRGALDVPLGLRVMSIFSQPSRREHV